MTGSDIYWLGVHKTGTTFLQACLEASHDALDRHKVSYQPLDEFRDAHTRPLLDRTGTLPPTPPPPPGKRRLIFDENILGLVQDVTAPDGLYPAGPWRADEMADRLDLDTPHLVLGLRGFAGFLPSLYCETLKSTPFQPFLAFLRTPEEQLSWQPLVSGLLRSFPRSDITIYTSDTLRGSEMQLLSYFTGIPITELHRADGSFERLGFSQQAVELMAETHAKAGVLGPQEAKRIAQDHPRGPGIARFNPWTQDERDRLDARYATDLKAISAWPRVTLLDPATLSA
jgi:hypothetical protein